MNIARNRMPSLCVLPRLWFLTVLNKSLKWQNCDRNLSVQEHFYYTAHQLVEHPPLKLAGCIRFWTVARKSSIGGLYVCAGGFTFVQGGLDIQIWQKFHQLIVFHISIRGDWSFVWGDKPTKAPHPVATELVRFPLGSYRRPVKRYLRPVQPRARR